ncbi:MAG: putative Ig domain-containing protein [Acidobacteria bacterium]|nr:putative Ig domain-containing protein [Acidobacteriota bacterium]
MQYTSTRTLIFSIILFLTAGWLWRSQLVSQAAVTNKATVPFATCTWDGTSGDWTNTAKWSCGAVPGPGDTATINGGTVTVSALESVGTLTLNGGNVSINAAQTLTAANCTLGNGNLTGAGDVTITSALDWTGAGDQSGAGTTTIAVGATLNLSGTGSKDIFQRTLNNFGTTNVTTAGSGHLFLQGSATFNNQAGALFHQQTDTDITNSGGGGTFAFNNAGTFRRSGTGDSLVGVPFNHSGSVEVQSGSVSLFGSGMSNSPMTVSSGATLAFTGGAYTLNNGAALDGAGAYLLSDANLGGTLLNVAGTVATAATSTFTHAEGSVGGTGNLIVNGVYNWSGFGDQTGTGTTTIAVGATLNLSGTGSKDIFQRTLNNFGTTNVTTTGSGHLFLQLLATFNNQAGALFHQQTDTDITNSGGAAPNNFNNAGTFRRTGTGDCQVGTGSGGGSALIFNNTGLVEVLSGSLSLANNGTSTSTMTTSAGATLAIVAGTYNLNTGAALNGTGTYLVSIGTLSVLSTVNVAATATFNHTEGVVGGTGNLIVNGVYNWSGAGDQTGTGTTTIAVGATLNLSGTGDKQIFQRTLNNFGTTNVTTTGNGHLTLRDQATFNNQAGALFHQQTDTDILHSAGPNNFNNAGTFRKTGAGDCMVGAPGNGLTFNNTGLMELLGGSVTVSGPIQFIHTAGTTLLNGGGLVFGATGQFQGGLLTGVGTITGNVNNSGATVAPGLSPGGLTITGNYTQGANGTLALELGGLTALTEFDRLAVNGAATLNGTLALTGVNGFAPTVGNTFQVVNYGSRTGTFANLSVNNLGAVGLQQNYNAANLTLQTIACDFAIAPTAAAYSSQAGAGNVAVTAAAGCNWTAVSNDAWLTVTGGASGTGNGTVTYSVAANLGPPRMGTLTIAGLTHTVTQNGSTQACAPLPTNALAWWTANNTANDRVGTNHGTLMGGASFTTLAGGFVNQAFSFDGVNDHVGLNSTGIVKGQSAATVDAWVRPTGAHGAPSGTGAVWFEATSAGGSITRFGLFVLSNGRVQVAGRDSENGAVSSLNSVATIPLNQWTHIAGSWQAGVGLKVYINGLLNNQAVLPGLGAFTNSNSQNVLIGASLSSSSNDNFNGQLDEVEVFNRALSAAEIQAIFNADRTGNCLCPTITVNPATLPNGVMGQGYNQMLSATGSTSSYTFAITSGVLPTGVTLSTGGVLSGTTTVAGTFNFTVMATDASNCSGTRAYTLNIINCPTLTVNPAALMNGFAGTLYGQPLTASGGTAPYTFNVTTGSLPGGLTLASGGALTGTPTTSGTFSFTVTATDSTGCTGTRSYTVIISGNGLQFFPLPSPVRLLDTRAGATACTQPNAPIAGGTSLPQAGRSLCTIPANAVALTGNITTVNSGGGFLTLYPSNATQPTVASTNYGPNEIINNVFTVGLGADGAFRIFAATTTDVVVDVTGYYAPPATGGLFFHPLPAPVRLLETRAGQPIGCVLPGAPLAGNSESTQQAISACTGIPAAARAIVGNATTVAPQGGGFLTIFPADATRPLVASSNYNPGQVVNGPFSVGLTATGQFKIFTTATTDLVVDVLGYYSTEATDANGAGLLLTPLAHPIRLLETRANQAVGCFKPGAPLAGGSETTQPARGLCDGITIPANALGVVGNATVVFPAGPGFVTLWPSTATRPTVATLNYNTGDVGNRHFIVGLGSGDGAFKVFTAATTELVIDLSGYFAP